MKKLSSLPELQLKEKDSSPSSIGFESSQVQAEIIVYLNVVSKLAQKNCKQ